MVCRAEGGEDEGSLGIERQRHGALLAFLGENLALPAFRGAAASDTFLSLFLSSWTPSSGCVLCVGCVARAKAVFYWLSGRASLRSYTFSQLTSLLGFAFLLSRCLMAVDP